MTPCYVGTSVETRAEGDIVTEMRSSEAEEHEIVDTAAAIAAIKIKNELEKKKLELFAERNMI